VDEIQIGFRLPAIRAHAGLCRDVKTDLTLQLRISVEDVEYNLARVFLQPVMVVAGMAKKIKCRRKFKLIDG